MDATQRRAQIAEYLSHAGAPVSASALAGRFRVSRQIIVGDIALLRASGLEIAATPRGYMPPQHDGGVLHTVACIHAPQDMAQELELIVDHGCTVVDVIVEHPVYGQITGQLQLSSRYDVRQFIQKVTASDAKPLSDLTHGVHLHSIRCPGEDAYRRVLAALEQAGYLYSADS